MQRTLAAIRKGLLVLTAMGLSVLVEAPEFTGLLEARERSSEATGYLRVATFNVNRREDIEGLARAIRSHPELGRADVLFLQEIETSGDWHGPEELARRLGLELLYAPSRREGNVTHGVAILSRYPLTDPEIVSLTRYDLGYRSRNRIALGATVALGVTRLRLYNVHLDTRLTLEERIAQIEPVVAQALAAPHALIGGDVNTIRAVPVFLPFLPLPIPGLGQAEGLDRFMRGLGFEIPFADVGGTGPLGMRLDAVFCRGLAVIASGKAPLPGLSDHAPLWVDLQLPTLP